MIGREIISDKKDGNMNQISDGRDEFDVKKGNTNTVYWSAGIHRYHSPT